MASRFANIILREKEQERYGLDTVSDTGDNTADYCNIAKVRAGLGLNGKGKAWFSLASRIEHIALGPRSGRRSQALLVPFFHPVLSLSAMPVQRSSLERRWKPVACPELGRREWSKDFYLSLTTGSAIYIHTFCNLM